MGGRRNGWARTEHLLDGSVADFCGFYCDVFESENGLAQHEQGWVMILSRSEKRAMERAKEKHVRHLMSGGYGPFKDITDSEITLSLVEKMSVRPEKVYMNGLFIVQVFPWKCDWGDCKRIMIRWNDARPEHDWSIFQKIKNDIFGEDRVALEVYPAEKNKQDVANMYWLFLLPDGLNCPIEWKREARD